MLEMRSQMGCYIEYTYVFTILPIYSTGIHMTSKPKETKEIYIWGAWGIW